MRLFDKSIPCSQYNIWLQRRIHAFSLHSENTLFLIKENNGTLTEFVLMSANNGSNSLCESLRACKAVFIYSDLTN